MRPNGSPQELERRRQAAIALLKEGFMPHEVAKRLEVDRRSVRRWRSAYRRRGLGALKAMPAPGRPTKLSARARERLRRMLVKGASACGFPTDLWTCPRVVEFIKREFHITYHRAHLSRLLHGLGMTPQKPSRQPRERNEKQVRGWVATTWEVAKKKSAG